MKNINLGVHFLLLTFFENFNFKSTLFTKIMPIFRSLDLERMLIYQEIFFIGKVLFFSPLSYHLMCKLLKKSYMLSNEQHVNCMDLVIKNSPMVWKKCFQLPTLYDNMTLPFHQRKFEIVFLTQPIPHNVSNSHQLGE